MVENEFVKCWKNIVEKEITKLTDEEPQVFLAIYKSYYVFK